MLRQILTIRTTGIRTTGIRTKGERGLTLVEIIVVLIILSSLMAFLAGKLFSTADSAKEKLNRLKMEKLRGMISQYQLQYNALPGGLDTLINGPSGAGDSFVKIAEDDDLKDSWGNSFQYALENNGRSYRIKTLGADGIEGGSGVDFDFSLSGP